MVKIISSIIYYIRAYYCAKNINEKAASDINLSYKNYFLVDAPGYQPKIPNIDPAGAMKLITTKKITRLMSGNIPVILQRIEDCLKYQNSTIKQLQSNTSLYKEKRFMLKILNNTLLYHFMVSLLILSKSNRNTQFKTFSNNIIYLYDLQDGHFKDYTTISYSSKQK